MSHIAQTVDQDKIPATKSGVHQRGGLAISGDFDAPFLEIGKELDQAVQKRIYVRSLAGWMSDN